MASLFLFSAMPYMKFYVNREFRSICSPWVMTTPCDHAIGSMVRDVWGPTPEILDTITVESILNAG